MSAASQNKSSRFQTGGVTGAAPPRFGKKILLSPRCWKTDCCLMWPSRLGSCISRLEKGNNSDEV